MAGLYWGLYFGTPSRNVKPGLASLDVSVIQDNLPVIEDVIKDNRLIGILKSILPLLIQFTDQAKHILEWEQAQVPSKVRKAHSIISYRKGPRRPPWAVETEYQNTLASSANAFRAYLDVLEQSEAILRAILPTSTDPTYMTQLERAYCQIPRLRLFLDLGYEEALRMKLPVDWPNPPAG